MNKIKDFANYEKVLIKSSGKIVLNNDIHDENLADNENTVATIAYSNIPAQMEIKLPMRVYVISVIIGLLLLLLSTIGFWKVPTIFKF